MNIEVKSGKITSQTADALVVTLFEGEKKLAGEAAALDKILVGAITQSIKQGRISGKNGDMEVFHTPGDIPASLVVVMGLGKKETLTTDKLRGDVAGLCRTLRSNKAVSLALEFPDLLFPVEERAQAIAEGALLGLYTFRRHITKKADYPEMETLTIVAAAAETAGIKKGIEKGQIMATAANLARDMENEPSNFMTPSDIAAVAKEVAGRYKLELTVMERDEMEALGMTAAL